MKIKYTHSIRAAALGIIFNTLGALVETLHWEFDLDTIKVNGSNLLMIEAIFCIAGTFSLLLKAEFVRGNDSLNGLEIATT
jgi:hypothetical protein